MAKTNMIMREKRRLKVAKKYAARRAELPKDGGERARKGEGGFAAAAARCGGEPAAQPLFHNRTFARRVPQVWIGAHQTARSGQSWGNSGPVEGQLVRRAQ